MNRDDAAEVVESIIAKEVLLPEAAYKRLGTRKAFTIVGTAMEEAVHRKFPPDTDLTEITSYARQLRKRFPDAHDELRPLNVEGAIRGALGEEELLEGLSGDDLHTISILATYAMISDLKLTQEQKNQFVQEVIDRASQFEA